MKLRTLLILALATVAQPLISFATPPKKTAEATPFGGLNSQVIKTLKPIQPAKFELASEVASLPAPAPIIAAPAPIAVVGCGSDSMMAYIYRVESGCSTAAYNSGGCRGLGQSCPGSKLPCSDYDWTCQDNWFRAYAVSAYGSIYNAYVFRQSHNWW